MAAIVGVYLKSRISSLLRDLMREGEDGRDETKDDCLPGNLNVWNNHGMYKANGLEGIYKAKPAGKDINESGSTVVSSAIDRVRYG